MLQPSDAVLCPKCGSPSQISIEDTDEQLDCFVCGYHRTFKVTVVDGDFGAIPNCEVHELDGYGGYSVTVNGETQIGSFATPQAESEFIKQVASASLLTAASYTKLVDGKIQRTQLVPQQ